MGRLTLPVTLYLHVFSIIFRTVLSDSKCEMESEMMTLMPDQVNWTRISLGPTSYVILKRPRFWKSLSVKLSGLLTVAVSAS